MPKAELPPDEEQRLATLSEYQLLDTSREPSFDRIVALAANACETPIALFSLVDRDRQWFEARVGLATEQTDREVSFCAHAVARDDLLVVEDARSDPRFLENALVVDKPNIRFYAGAPVHAHDAQPLGALCVIDHVARSLSADDRVTLEGLARELEAQLEIRRLSLQQQALVEERAILMSMILHDARGVLGSMGWGLKLLRDRLGDGVEALDQIHESYEELLRLCESVAGINVTESRGLPLNVRQSNLGEWLPSTARRCRAIVEQAGMTLEADVEVSDLTVETDTGLIDRMLRNLCYNATEFCPAGATVWLRAQLTEDDHVRLTVEDNGPGVAAEHVEHIFEPYFSRRVSGAQGHGLGLAICRLAVQALDGTIDYEARESGGARFVIRLPVRKTI